MEQIYKDRLLHLADFLEKKVPDKHFDLNHIVFDKDGCNWHTLKDKLNQVLEKKETSCGAVACCIGWMPGAFPQDFIWAALKIQNIKTGSWTWVAAEEFFGLRDIYIKVLNDDDIKIFISKLDGEDVYNTDFDALDYLFMPYTYENYDIVPSKRNAIKRIRSLVSQLNQESPSGD